MTVPFSLPMLDQSVIDEVLDALTNTGWITTGPKVQQFEEAIRQYTGAAGAIATSSWTSGAMVVLRWLGIGPGDEVVVPAYTYCATALAVMNVGATPVMVDIASPFHVTSECISSAITERTKAIIPVDVGGWPCDYAEIHKLVTSAEVRAKFKPRSVVQEKLGRPLVIADSAHSLGAEQDDCRVGTLADVTVLSFHSVKNLTTGEGGMICLNLPEPFDQTDEQRVIRYLGLNGQTKTALEKSMVGGWKYDIVDQGFKANMPDLCAAVGLAQIRQYEDKMLPERRRIFEAYNEILKDHEWAILPPMSCHRNRSSYHLYQLRIRSADQAARDHMMQRIAEDGFGVNVHYVPMPMLTLFRNRGFDISQFPISFAHYENEITLPVYNKLDLNTVRQIAESVVSAHTSLSPVA